MVNELLLFKVKEWKRVARFQTRRRGKAGMVQRHNLTVVVLETENWPPVFVGGGTCWCAALGMGELLSLESSQEPRVLGPFP